MNKTLNSVLLVLVIVVLAGAIFFAGGMYSRWNMMSGWGNNQYGAGMMSNGRMMNGMMGGTNMMHQGMMNQYGYNNSNLTPLSVDQAKSAAEQYIQSLDISGLEVGEVMIFDNNGYVVVEESETGYGAFELLIDPVTQIAYPEHGPNMMWNLKYSGFNHESMMGNGMTLAPGASAGVGMMGGNGGMMNMMNGWSSSTPVEVSAEMTVTPEQAIDYAQSYLGANIAGATAAEDPIQFYGYYTLDYEKDGKVAGMLSVNGYNGQVFLHTWHGAFIEETE